jgi:hypothetical protein
MLDAVQFQLNGQVYNIRPRFRAIVSIEKRLGRGIIQSQQTEKDSDTPAIGFTDVATILHEALVAEKIRHLSLEDVGAAIMDEGGLIAFMPYAVQYLVGALSAGPSEGFDGTSVDTKS